MKPRLTLRWKLFFLFLIPFLISLWWIGKAGQFGKEGFPWLFFFLIFLPGLAIWFWGISRILTEPLREISDVAGKFAEGLFNWRIRLAERRDELSALGEQLNQMAEAMGEKIEGLSKALAESQALLNGMEEGVLILDLHGRVRKMNTSMEAVLSHAYPTDIGKHYLEVFRDPELNEIIQTTLKEKKGQRRGLSPLGRPGKNFQVQSSLIHYPESGGEGVIVVFHDITELKRLERIRQDFVANVSHELRTPLTTIRGYVEALQDDGLDNISQAKQFLQIIERHTQRMEKIVSDLLLLSEIEAPDRMLRKESLALADLISIVVESLRPVAESKKQTIQLKISADLPFIFGDSQKIHQVIVNLLSNAISYTEYGGHIAVEVRGTEKGVEISVADNGIGISPEHLPRVFERFYRVDRGRSREEGGTGLGLSIVKHIVEAHGGWVSVESKPGQGSRFSFFLPQA
jgi:two-component system, OmpR family, phosphate regulon sensor histidine kinase PhoR